MLDDKFQTTQIVGYSMESTKHLQYLLNLVRTDRTYLDSEVWKAADEAFQRIVPGLTVWQMRHAQSMLAQIR